MPRLTLSRTMQADLKQAKSEAGVESHIHGKYNNTTHGKNNYTFQGKNNNAIHGLECVQVSKSVEGVFSYHHTEGEDVCGLYLVGR